MDSRLLRYYSRELQHLRESAGQFAKDFPKIAGRLGVESWECGDGFCNTDACQRAAGDSDGADRAAVQHRRERRVGPAPREEGRLQRHQQGNVGRTRRAHGTHERWILRLVDREEPRQPALDQLLVDEVGFDDPGLGPGRVDVVDLDCERRSGQHIGVIDAEAGQRSLVGCHRVGRELEVGDLLGRQRVAVGHQRSGCLDRCVGSGGRRGIPSVVALGRLSGRAGGERHTAR